MTNSISSSLITSSTSTNTSSTSTSTSITLSPSTSTSTSITPFPCITNAPLRPLILYCYANPHNINTNVPRTFTISPSGSLNLKKHEFFESYTPKGKPIREKEDLALLQQLFDSQKSNISAWTDFFISQENKHREQVLKNQVTQTNPLQPPSGKNKKDSEKERPSYFQKMGLHGLNIEKNTADLQQKMHALQANIPARTEAFISQEKK